MEKQRKIPNLLGSRLLLAFGIGITIASTCLLIFFVAAFIQKKLDLVAIIGIISAICLLAGGIVMIVLGQKFMKQNLALIAPFKPSQILGKKGSITLLVVGIFLTIVCLFLTFVVVILSNGTIEVIHIALILCLLILLATSVGMLCFGARYLKKNKVLNK